MSTSADQFYFLVLTRSGQTGILDALKNEFGQKWILNCFEAEFAKPLVVHVQIKASSITNGLPNSYVSNSFILARKEMISEGTCTNEGFFCRKPSSITDTINMRSSWMRFLNFYLCLLQQIILSLFMFVQGHS